MPSVIEVLQYTLKPGTGEAFHAVMKDQSIPLHESCGLNVKNSVTHWIITINIISFAHFLIYHKWKPSLRNFMPMSAGEKGHEAKSSI